MSTSPSSSDGFAALRKFLGRTPAKRIPGERCEFCAVPIGESHSHLVDLRDRKLMCACRPCAIVFQPKGAALGRYKVVPSRYEFFADVQWSDARWDQLQIPINLAFFFHNTSVGKMVAFYPSPAGATESLLPLDMWSDAIAEYPVLDRGEPDVEAVLVYRKRDGTSLTLLVPIDACYELIALIRMTWKGFDGGTESWQRIDEFFDGLRAKCDVITAAVAP